MKKSSFLVIISIACALLLSSCTGGGRAGSTPPLPTSIPFFVPSPSPSPTNTQVPTPNVGTTTRVVVNIAATADLTQQSIARHVSSAGRAAKYISASAMGVKVAAAGLTTQVFDVSSGSALCTGSGSGRTCSLNLVVNPGSYAFTLTVYDATPVAGAIPGTANVLGVSTVSQTINPNVTNTLVFLVGGQVTSISNGSLYFSLPTNGSPISAGIAYLTTDHGGNTIATGPFANPIGVSIAETGGPGHAYLKINGVNVGLSGTLSNSADVATINYDGVASAGYTDVVSFTAAGSTSSSVRMSPLFVSGIASPTGAGNTANLTITEASAPVSVAYNQSLTGCASVATVPAAGAGSGPSGAASVTDTVQPAGGKTCTLTISDNLGSSVSRTVTIPAGTPTCASAAAATQLTPIKVASGTPCVPSAGYGVTATYATSAGTINVTEVNDQSTLTESDTCSGLASVSPASQAGAGTPTGTANAFFTVTATSNTNSSCNVTINDGNGQSSVFPVTVAQPPPVYECSDQPNSASLGSYNGSNYYSNGVRCIIQGLNPTGSVLNVYLNPANGANNYGFNIAENEDTTPVSVALVGNCFGFASSSTSSGASPIQTQVFNGYASATASNVGTSCSLTFSDVAGQSYSITFNYRP